MNKVKASINPFTLLFKLSGIGLFGSLLIHFTITIATKPGKFAAPEILFPGIFVFLFFTYIVTSIIHSLFNGTKIVTFGPDAICAFYPLRLKKVRFKKGEILGFTRREIRHNLRSVTIYSNHDDVIELTSKDISGFDTLSKYLEKNFKYLGIEPFSRNFWWKRKCKYPKQ